LNYDKFEAIVWDFIKNNSYVFANLDEEEKATKVVAFEKERQKADEAIKLKQKFIQQEKQKVSDLINMVKLSGGAFIMDDIIKDKNEIDKNIELYEKEINKSKSEIELYNNRIEQILNADFDQDSIFNIEADRNQMKKVIQEVIDHIMVYKIDNNSVVLQLATTEDSTIYNILLNQRSKKISKYWYIEEHVASFLRGKHAAPGLEHCDNFYFYNPTELTAEGFPYWGYYVFDEMCSILEHSGMYSEYMPPKEYINPLSKRPETIPEDEYEFREYMTQKFGTAFESEEMDC
jgi:hypothetical protein